MELKQDLDLRWRAGHARVLRILHRISIDTTFTFTTAAIYVPKSWEVRPRTESTELPNLYNQGIANKTLPTVETHGYESVRKAS